MFEKKKRNIFALRYAEAMVILSALSSARVVTSKDEEAYKEWNSLKKWILAPEVSEKQMPLYLLKVKDFSNRMKSPDRVNQQKNYYYELLEKGYLEEREYEKLVRELGIWDWDILERISEKDPKYFNSLDSNIFIEYMNSLNEIPSLKNEALSSRFNEFFWRSMGQWKKKCEFVQLAESFPIESLLHFYNNEEMAEILQKKIPEDVLEQLEKELSPKRKKLIAWEMPAARYASTPWYINPFSKWISTEERVKYFSENISHSNSLCYGFMDKERGIMSLIGTDNEVLTLEQVAAVMKNYEPEKEEVFFRELFRLYETQKKRFEK